MGVRRVAIGEYLEAWWYISDIGKLLLVMDDWNMLGSSGANFLGRMLRNLPKYVSLQFLFDCVRLAFASLELHISTWINASCFIALSVCIKQSIWSLLVCVDAAAKFSHKLFVCVVFERFKTHFSAFDCKNVCVETEKDFFSALQLTAWKLVGKSGWLKSIKGLLRLGIDNSGESFNFLLVTLFLIIKKLISC